MVLGKEVHVLPGAVTFVLELSPKKRLSLCLSCWVVGWYPLALQFVSGAVGSLVGTLSGLCPVHQWALQFVELCGSAGWYLEWALPGPPACVCDPCVVNVFCVSHGFIPP